ncbi:hypothetical protein TREES_T100000159 [Tupaia chinensis]|uniref:Uncharacterized protein n=1 Tax=Tupaia chinensis TaxID=246437 RepID=L9LC70_TUPCH|nr:hypothetical protein TREES_T100000159 [Tupaia chinensis]
MLMDSNCLGLSPSHEEDSGYLRAFCESLITVQGIQTRLELAESEGGKQMRVSLERRCWETWILALGHTCVID